MDPYDDDSQMRDVPESYARGISHTSERAEGSVHGSVLSSNVAGMWAPNGLQGPQRYAISSSGAEHLNPTTRRLQEPSRESSVLANNVANHLSIESSEDPVLQEPEDFTDELDDAEHGPTAPYLSSLPTGLCYDVRMRYHCELDPPKQSRDFHPEDPRRIFKIYKELCMAGLVNDPMLNTGNLIPNPLLRINARNVSESEVCLVHDKKHWDFMVATASMATDDLVILEKTFDSIYLNVTTFGCALLSAGGAIETCRAVTSRQVKNAIAVIRPPGHHAECNQPMGFCIFDNVSIAAKVCQLDYQETCRKILILDWDVHHGNGIQQAFYQDPDVLYISLHVHEDGNFYPSGNYGDHMHCGGGPGLGKNVNIPWPTKGMGDADYMLAFQHIVMPVAYEFDPDLVIIAAGFDAAEGDQLGGCFVTPACYAQMTHMLMGLAQGMLVVCLEGGYNLTSISKSALAVTRTLIGEMPDRIRDTKATETGIETVQMVAMYQSQFWPSLYPKDAHQEIGNKLGAERMHDVVRYYQASQLKENHKMVKVMVYREKLSKSFENQVIATPNFEDAVPLVVIFHDPPELMGTTNPVTHKLELHNTWLADDLKHYVDWAANLGYGVVDVNVPKHLTSTEENEGYRAEIDAERRSASNELAVYLWENYIDCNDATEIFFLGVGYAYDSIIHLLINRGQYSFQPSSFHKGSHQLTKLQCPEEDFTKRVTGMVNFISENSLKAVSDHGFYQHGQSLSKWYRAHSLNFVANSHLVWDIDGSKKPSKRFGNLVRSPMNGLNDMLGQHQEEVQGFITRRVVRRDDTEEEKIN